MTVTFWQQFILNAVGPLITILGGYLIVGLLVARITREAQDRREERQLRDHLISEATENAGLLHFEIQRYYRAKKKRQPTTRSATPSSGSCKLCGRS